MRQINPRSITDAERPWIEAWSPDAHLVLLREIRERSTNRMALNVCSYIATRAIGEETGASMQAKADYRKLLAELADAGVTPPPPGRRLVAVTPLAYDGAGRPVRVPAEEAPVSTSAPAARRRRPQSGYAELGLVAAVAGVAAILRMPPEVVAGVAQMAGAENRCGDELCEVDLADAA